VVIASNGRPILHSFAGDPFPVCADYLRLGRVEPEAFDRAEWLRRKAEREAAERREAAQTLAFVQGVLAGVEPLAGTPAERYLFGRGLLLEDAEDVGFHPAAPRCREVTPRSPSPAPAMVAIVRDVLGRAVGAHVTYIRPDGRGKAFGDRSRLMFGKVSGCAVRLAQMGPDGVLGVGEGIETSGAFGALRGAPSWALLSTSLMQGFVPPPGLRKLLIGVDMDDGGAGMKAALMLAERVRRFVDVELHPAPDGLDWADVAEAQA
jgi:hypothetical protein